MNQIKIANILVQKRREKGITQEELAAYMGVSKAAVSKWENAQSYPDITLLPQLATYFNVSVDELLGYSPQLTREDTWKLCQRLSEDFTSKPFDEVLGECKTIIKQYYSCFPLLYQMAILLANHHIFAKTDEKRDEVLMEAKGLCQRIVMDSGDALLSRDALYAQCHFSNMLRMPDEVFDLLGETLRMPEITEDSLIAHAFQLAGNTSKAKEIAQCGMYEHLMSLIEATLSYALLSADMYDTTIEAYNRVMELIHLYNVENLNVHTTSKAYLIGVNLYCTHGYVEQSLKLLERYVDLCVTANYPFKVQGDAFFTKIDDWLDSGELGSSAKYDTKMIRQNMLQNLDLFPSIEVLHNEPRYKSIIQKLSKYVNAE